MKRFVVIRPVLSLVKGISNSMLVIGIKALNLCVLWSFHAVRVRVIREERC